MVDRPAASAAPPATLQASAAPLKGIALMVAGFGLFTVSDALSKWLVESYPIGQYVCMRAAFALLPVAVLVWRAGGIGQLRVRNVSGQAARAGALVFGSTMVVAAVWLLPIAQVTAILFSSPIMIAALSGPMLGEKVGWRRWIAIGVGFVGVLVIVRPAGLGLPGGGFEWAVAVPLMAALGFSLRDLLTRSLRHSETAAAMLFWGIAAQLLAGLATAPFDLQVAGGAWRPVQPAHWLPLLAAGLISGSGQLLVIQAFRNAEASLLAPFKYTSLLWATALGYVFWGELPGPGVWAGAAIVAASGLYIVHREREARG